MSIRHHPPWLGIRSGRSLRGCCASTITLGVLSTPSVRQESSKINQPSACGLFLSYPAKLLDSKALSQQLRVVPHHHSILIHGYHPSWLSIRFGRPFRGASHSLRSDLLCLGRPTAYGQVNWALDPELQIYIRKFCRKIFIPNH